MPIPAGTEVAGYRIERVLGAGGMGTVYLAQHPSLPRRDALKVLSAELSYDKQFRPKHCRSIHATTTSWKGWPNKRAALTLGDACSAVGS
jgi:eukaryotic-like serine/threonine-protein kinase